MRMFSESAMRTAHENPLGYSVGSSKLQSGTNGAGANGAGWKYGDSVWIVTMKWFSAPTRLYW